MSLADLIVELGGPRAVAQATGLSFKHVDNLAQGRRRPTGDVFRRLATSYPSVPRRLILELAEGSLRVPPSFWLELAGAR